MGFNSWSLRVVVIVVGKGGWGVEYWFWLGGVEICFFEWEFGVGSVGFGWGRLFVGMGGNRRRGGYVLKVLGCVGGVVGVGDLVLFWWEVFFWVLGVIWVLMGVYERNGRGVGGFWVVGWDVVMDVVWEGVDVFFRVWVVGGGGGGNDGGFVVFVGVGGEVVFEGIYVWGYYGDVVEYDVELEGDGEGDEM